MTPRSFTIKQAGTPEFYDYLDEREKVAQQIVEPDPRKWKIHRNRRGWPRWYQRWLEAWWIVTGRWSLHRAWQDGVWHGSQMEYTRIVINGGR